jgi:hypothetical protein
MLRATLHPSPHAGKALAVILGFLAVPQSTFARSLLGGFLVAAVFVAFMIVFISLYITESLIESWQSTLACSDMAYTSAHLGR